MKNILKRKEEREKKRKRKKDICIASNLKYVLEIKEGFISLPL